MDATPETIQPSNNSSPVNLQPENGANHQFHNRTSRRENHFSNRGRSKFTKRDDRERPKDEFDSKLLDLARVSHTRAGGRRLRFRAIVVSGNKAGKVGLGVASGLDVAQAVEKATILSKKYAYRAHCKWNYFSRSHC